MKLQMPCPKNPQNSHKRVNVEGGLKFYFFPVFSQRNMMSTASGMQRNSGMNEEEYMANFNSGNQVINIQSQD